MANVIMPMHRIETHEDQSKFLKEIFDQIDKVLDHEEKFWDRGQMPYGLTPVGRLAIQRIIAFRAAGMGFVQIAKLFNSYGVATKRKGTKWHGCTINKMVRLMTRSHSDFLVAALTPVPMKRPTWRPTKEGEEWGAARKEFDRRKREDHIRALDIKRKMVEILTQPMGAGA